MLLLMNSKKPKKTFNLLSGSLPLDLTYTGASNKTMFDSTGAMVYAPANMVYPSVPDATWSITAVARSYGAIANPLDGAVDGVKVTDNSTTVDHNLGATSANLVVGAGFDYSIYLKAGTEKIVQIATATAISGNSWANFNLETGEVGSSGVGATYAMQAIGGGWYRCTVTFTSSTATAAVVWVGFTNNSATATRFVSYSGAGNYFYLYGAKLERHSYNSPQPYIATTSAAYYGPRFDYNPSTLAMNGLLIEESRTNLVKNAILAGAAAPSTFPTNWVSVVTQGGITVEVISTGTDTNNQMPYVDVRYSGTASDTTSTIYYVNTIAEIPAAPTNVISSSMYIKLQAGSLTNVSSVGLVTRQYDGSTGGTTQAQSDIKANLSATPYRDTYTVTCGDAAVTAFRMGSRVLATNGAAVDLTLRFYYPQVEVGSFATSFIPTSGAAATRAAETLVATSIPWFNATQGTFVVEGISGGIGAANAYNASFSKDGSTNSFLNAYRLFTTGNAQNAVVLGGTAVGSNNGPVLAVGAAFKQGFVYTSGSNLGSANGTTFAGAPFAASNIPSDINRLDLGARNDGSRYGNIWLTGFKYYNTAKTQAQLNALTQ